MPIALRSHLLNLLHTLWFVPSLIALAYIALAEALVQVDDAVRFRNAAVFGGSAHAARSVLSVIAGSLITVAGLTFSVTMIVLQLTSSQFSPRVLRNYLGDRVAQVTIGSFVGIFAYCLLALRSIGEIGTDRPSVPRLTVTVASALALFALAMLIAFIHHTSQLVLASELTARLGRQTLAAVERLYPSRLDARSVLDDGAALVAEWHRDAPPGVVEDERVGFVQGVELATLIRGLPEPAVRVHLLLGPGDFAQADAPIAEVWPAESARELRTLLTRTFTVGGERDIDQDAQFGLRQLADIALRAISPSVNDPTTAVTCIGYIRSVLTRLAAREFPSAVLRQGADLPRLVVRRREFGEYLEPLAEIGRYSAGDARVVQHLLSALESIAAAALAADASERAEQAVAIARAVAEQARAEVGSARDRALVDSALRQIEEGIDALP